MGKVLTYFDNMRNMGSVTVHRVNTGSPFTACGLPLKGARRVASNVDCKRCMNTQTFKYGGRDVA